MNAVSDASVRFVAPDGELDLRTARLLASELSEAVGDSSRPVVVDLTGVSFIDSTGLGTIVKAHQRLHRQGRRMAVVASEGPVTRLMALTGLDKTVRVFADRTDAVAFVAP
jgi:anti-anti-sigma factor